MKVGDEEYRKMLRRWHTLMLRDRRTPAQEEELDRIEEQLTVAELKGKEVEAE
jgi:hypothetical protein